MTEQALCTSSVAQKNKMLLLACPVESDAAQHVTGNIKRAYIVLNFCFYFSIRLCSIASHADLSTLNWHDIMRVSLFHVAQNYSRLTVVVQKVLSVFFKWGVSLFC